MDRRDFLKTGGALAAANAISVEAAAASPKSPGVTARSFPKDFVWGTATAAYQVEGAVKEDGRGPSVWDTFSHQIGTTVGGATGDVADDHFHRYKEDVALMRALGVKGYRFSVSWSRVFPQSSGAPNPKGLDFYKRLLDELHTAGIEPYCTLFHWDLPQALEDRGGWTNRATGKAFADYAGYVASQLSDRIRNWMTINEFNSYIDAGYGSHPNHAPGRTVSQAELVQTRHYAALAHGMAVQAIRATAKRPVRVGLAEDVAGATPAIETPENIAAAQMAVRDRNAAYMTVIQEGRYTEAYLQRMGNNAPRFTAEELKIISTPLDFVGVNIYTANEVVAADTPLGYTWVKKPASYPHMVSEWLYFNPQAIYWTPKLMQSLWGVREMYITENGCSAADEVTPSGRVMDTDRVLYLRNYLTQLHRAVSEGVPVRGYFLWSLLDNFEWTKGYTHRFGITHVDFATQKRTPKLSYDFYRAVIARNGLA